MGVKYSDLPRTNTVHMDDRVAVLSSTDDILKTVPAGSLGGVFVGTSAQWAALTAEQKAQYDQKQVILTDGEGGGFNPVEITYADWMALPPAQRNAGTWLVTGFPVATNADLIPYTGDVQAANVGAAINALNQNLTKCLTYNETTDFYGAVNPNTQQWVDLLYAGFNQLDIIRKAWSDGETSRYTHLQGSVAGNVAMSGSFSITESNMIISSTTSGSGNTSFPVYYVVLKEPFYVTETNVLNLIGTSTASANNYQRHIFLCRDPELGNLTASNFQITDNRVKVIQYNNGAGSVDVSFRNSSLKDLVSSKWNDFENPFYIGFALSCNWSGPNGNITLSKCTVN